MSRGLFFGIPLALSVLVLGCSTPMRRGGDDLRAEIRSLQQRMLELQRQAAVSDVELARLQRKVAELESSGASSLREPVAEGAEPASPIAGLAEASSPAGAESLPVSRTTPREPSPPAVAVELESSAQPITPAAQALYDRGYTLYHQGELVEAEASFQRFLRGFPESELADNAQYWIGEARWARHDYRGALAAFRETVNRFPTGNKIPDALLKSGQCLEELGDSTGARDSYLEIRRRFPDSATALIAAERLSNLDV